LDRQERVVQWLKIFFKNSFDSPYEPTCGHESFLSARGSCANTQLVNVIENLVPTIKNKKLVIKISRTKHSHT
jgi:hypothetical protein